MWLNKTDHSSPSWVGATTTPVHLHGSPPQRLRGDACGGGRRQWHRPVTTPVTLCWPADNHVGGEEADTPNETACRALLSPTAQYCYWNYVSQLDKLGYYTGGAWRFCYLNDTASSGRAASFYKPYLALCNPILRRTRRKMPADRPEEAGSLSDRSSKAGKAVWVKNTR